MPINRRLWKQPFYEYRIPAWQCPTCFSGLLVLRENSFQFAQTTESKNAQPEEDWGDRDWITYTFSAILDCSNKACKECVTTCGQGGISEDYSPVEDGSYDLTYTKWFTPEYFFPPLVIFPVPRHCPQSVADETKASFRLFFCDQASASNHIRKAVENLMTEQGIKRFDTKNGQRVAVPLHRRIDLYSNRNRDIAELLMAIKWIGNAGSHAGEINKDDVLDAYEILEIVLDELDVIGNRR
jgi:hypothetical protein